MDEDQKEKFGLIIDGFENLVFALKMTALPDSIHMEGLRGSLPEKVEELKSFFIEITGENPWDE